MFAQLALEVLPRQRVVVVRALVGHLCFEPLAQTLVVNELDAALASTGLYSWVVIGFFFAPTYTAGDADILRTGALHFTCLVELFVWTFGLVFG